MIDQCLVYMIDSITPTPKCKVRMKSEHDFQDIDAFFKIGSNLV